MKFGAKHDAGSADWAVWDRQFDLTRVEDGTVYLTRWWILKTPKGGLALHRMLAPDARDTIHTHPFSFVSFPIVGGYVEKRLDPKTWKTRDRVISWRRGPRARGHERANLVRAGLDAHTIWKLLRVPTYTLLLIGPHRGTWGFLEPEDEALRASAFLGDKPNRWGYGPRRWQWTRHDDFDSGHYAPENSTRRR